MCRLLQRHAGPNTVWRPNACTYKLTVDWAEPYKSLAWAVGVLALVGEDVPGRERGKEWVMAILAIIPGPRVPELMRPYLETTLRAFAKLGVSGMRVQQRWYEESESGERALRVEEVEHFPYLSGIAADLQGARKLGNLAGNGAYVGSCIYCTYECTYVVHGGDVRGGIARPLGYHVAQPQTRR